MKQSSNKSHSHLRSLKTPYSLHILGKRSSLSPFSLPFIVLCVSLSCDSLFSVVGKTQEKRETGRDDDCDDDGNRPRGEET